MFAIGFRFYLHVKSFRVLNHSMNTIQAAVNQWLSHEDIVWNRCGRLDTIIAGLLITKARIVIRPAGHNSELIAKVDCPIIEFAIIKLPTPDFCDPGSTAKGANTNPVDALAPSTTLTSLSKP